MQALKTGAFITILGPHKQQELNTHLENRLSDVNLNKLVQDFQQNFPPH